MATGRGLGLTIVSGSLLASCRSHCHQVPFQAGPLLSVSRRGHRRRPSVEGAAFSHALSKQQTWDLGPGLPMPHHMGGMERGRGSHTATRASRDFSHLQTFPRAVLSPPQISPSKFIATPKGRVKPAPPLRRLPRLLLQCLVSFTGHRSSCPISPEIKSLRMVGSIPPFLAQLHGSLFAT